MSKHLRVALVIAVACLVLAAVPAWALDQATFEKNLTVHRLNNGLTFLIYERPGAPVVSFFTYVNAGSAQEVNGITGVAHMMEHMAFKGTPTVGTTDYQAEKKALDKVDRAYAAYDLERRKEGEPDPQKLAALEKAWRDAIEEADRYVVKNEYGEIIDREGGVGLNAGTADDSTVYFYSLPANKVELWAYLESERFLHPVLRQFYKERDVVMEERRLRVDSQPIGRLIEQFVGVAFVAHAYHHPGIGYMSDLKAFSREDAYAFFHKYYIPSNMVISIVGAVKADDVVPILDRYFGRLPKRPVPPPLRTVEPTQIAERIVRMPDRAQPVYAEGYHRPAVTDKDDAVYDAIADILSTGRTSRLYRSLVRDKKIAAFAGAFNGFPGQKYPNMMIFFAVSTPGHSNEEVQKAIREEIERIKTKPVSDEELQEVKTRAKANLIRGLQSNMGIARQLAFYQTLFHDWRELFDAVQKIDKVTKDDILRVAKATFTPTNRTVAMIVNENATAGSR